MINNFTQNSKFKIQNLFSHQGFKKYFANTSWLFAEKILRMGVGLFVGIWMARYLGPEKFGLLSYVGAFIGLLAPIGKLGFDGIIQREVAKDEDNINELLSSALFFKFIGNIVIVLISTSYMYFFKKDDIYFYLAFILSFIYVIKSFEVIEFYFRAKVKAKYITISNIIGFSISSVLKILFIVFKFNLIFFALANLIEAVIAVLFLWVYFAKEPFAISSKNIKIIKGKLLLQESWPLILSGFFALIYLNIDQVMIEEMLNSYEVGQYAVAVRISSAFYFIPLTIGWSVQSAIVNAKKQGKEVYYRRLEQLSLIMAILGYILIIPMSLFANEIMSFLFAKQYVLAGEVLSIHIWAGLFLFLNVIRSLWILNESYFKFSLFANIVAGLLNIALNYIWLPIHGINGAAWATLISYSFTYLFSGLFFAPIREVFFMQIKSLFLINLFYQIKKDKNAR